eukprot:UN00466
MAIVDLDRLGQCQVVTCSGVAHTGALSILREGMGVEDHASIEMPGVCGMWSLKKETKSEYESYLVEAFVEETRVLKVSETGLSELKDTNGLVLNKPRP